MDIFAQYVANHMFLQSLCPTPKTPVRQFTPRAGNLFTKLSWDREIKGVPFTVEAYKINNRKHYYLNVIFNGASLTKICPKTSLYAAAAETLYKYAQHIVNVQTSKSR